jgi:hypothetical protein
MRQVGGHYREAHYIYHTPEGNMWFGSTPFGPQGRMVPRSSGWIISEGTHFELRFSTLVSALTRIARVQRSAIQVTDAHRAWYMDSLLADYPTEYRDGERTAAEWAEWSTTVPAYDALLEDSEGQIWARLYPYDASTATWDIFDAEGRLVATAATPARLDVKQIGADWLLGQTKGEMDEPLVMLYRLDRPID